MSLFQRSDGILETHVTWDDVEAEIQQTLRTEAIFGPGKFAKNIGDQKGHMSIIALIDPDWKNAKDEEKLPERFCVKIATQLVYTKVSDNLNISKNDQKLDFFTKVARDAHNREIQAYRLIEESGNGQIPFTKIHGSKSFSNETDLKGFIIMDYIPEAFTFSAWQSISAKNLIPVIQGIAKFATFEIPENLAIGPDFLEIFFITFMEKSAIEATFEKLRTVFEKKQSLEVEKLIDVYKFYIEIVPKFSRISKLLNFHLVSNHGDLWQGNFLYKSGKNGDLKLEAIIDWQAVSRMSPGFDVARLFLCCLSTKDRRQSSRSLLEVYHKTYHSKLESEKYPLQQLIDSYNLHLPMVSFLVLPGLISHLENSEVSEKVMEKMQGIVEDVLEAHEFNLTRFPDFLNSRK